MLKIINIRAELSIRRLTAFAIFRIKDGTRGVREGGENPPLPRNCKRGEPEHMPLGYSREGVLARNIRASQETGHELALGRSASMGESMWLPHFVGSLLRAVPGKLTSEGEAPCHF